MQHGGTTEPDVVAPHLHDRLLKLFSSLEASSGDQIQTSLVNLEDFVVSNSVNILCGRNGLLDLFIQQCELALEALSPEIGYQPALMILNARHTHQGNTLRHRVLAAVWRFITSKDFATTTPNESSTFLKLIIDIVSGRPNGPLDMVEPLCADCVSWLSSPGQDVNRRIFACQLLYELIITEKSIDRSISSYRELSIAQLWDISVRSLSQGYGALAKAVIQFAVCLMPIFLVETGSSVADEYTSLIFKGFNSETQNWNSCSASLLLYNSASAKSCKFVEDTHTTVMKEVMRCPPSLEACETLCNLVFASGKTDQVFSKLFEFLMMIGDNEISQCAANGLGASVEKWYHPDRSAAIFKAVRNVIMKPEGGEYTHIINLLGSIVAFANGEARWVVSLLVSVPLKNTRPFGTVAELFNILNKNGCEGLMKDYKFPVVDMLSFDQEMDKESLVECLKLARGHRSVGYFKEVGLLLRHCDEDVRFEACKCVLALGKLVGGANAVGGSMRLDSAVATVVEKLVDIVVADMNPAIRLYVLSELYHNAKLYAYLSFSDNLSGIFMAFHDVDDRCSQAALGLLCKLLPCHPADVRDRLEKIQIDILGEIEDRISVRVVSRAVGRMRIMLKMDIMLVPLKQIEVAIIDKLERKGSMLTNTLVVELLELFSLSLEKAVPQLEFASAMRPVMYYIKEGQSSSVSIAALEALGSLLQVYDVHHHTAAQDIFITLGSIIEDDNCQPERVQRQAISTMSIFGAINPVRLHSHQKTLLFENPDEPIFPKPIPRCTPRFIDNIPFVCVYFAAKALDGSPVEKHTELLERIGCILRHSNLNIKYAMLPSIIPFLVKRLLNPEWSSSHYIILVILKDLCPLLSPIHPNQANTVLDAMEKFAAINESGPSHVQCLILGVLDQLAKSLQDFSKMQESRWAIEFVVARLIDPFDAKLVLSATKALLSYVSFMQPKDVRHVVPLVLHTICIRYSVREADFTGTEVEYSPVLISYACLELIDYVIANHSTIARDISTLIIHRILEFSTSQPTLKLCEAGMRTIHALYTSMSGGSKGWRFNDLLHRASRQMPILQKSPSFHAIFRSEESQFAVQDYHKVKIPTAGDNKVDNSEKAVGVSYVMESRLPTLSIQQFYDGLWSLNISPLHVEVSSHKHEGDKTIIEFSFPMGRGAAKRIRNFFDSAKSANGVLRSALQIIAVKPKKELFLPVDPSFLNAVKSYPSPQKRKKEAVWMTWFHNVCLVILSVSPYSYLQFLVSIAKDNISIAKGIFPYAIRAIIAHMEFQDIKTLFQCLSEALLRGPLELKHVLLDFAEFVDVERDEFSKGIVSKESRELLNKEGNSFISVELINVFRDPVTLKFGVNYDQRSESVIEVNKVASGGSCERAGVIKGSRLLEIDGKKVVSMNDIQHMIEGKSAIKLLLSRQVSDEEYSKNAFLSSDTLAQVSACSDHHSKVIYFNEIRFKNLVSKYKAGGPSVIKRRTELLESVKVLLSLYQRVSLTMEAKGVVNFVGELFSDSVLEEGIFDEAGTLEQLHWWSEASRLYEPRMLKDEAGLLGIVRCWDALGEMRKIIQISNFIEGLSPMASDALEVYKANAAFVLGEWEMFETLGKKEAVMEGLDPVTKSALYIHQGRLSEARLFVDQTMDATFENFTEHFREGYARAYDMVVLMQHLQHLRETMEYMSASEERKDIFRNLWANRTHLLSKPAHWRAAIAINSLVLSKEEDKALRLEAAYIFSQTQARSLGAHILEEYLVTKDLRSNECWSTKDPHVLYAYAQYVNSSCDVTERERAFKWLSKVLSAPGAEERGDEPVYGNCWLLLGEIASRKRNADIALGYLEKSALINPKNYRSFYALGRVHQLIASRIEQEKGSETDRIQSIVAAISSLFKSVLLTDNRNINMQDILRILALWFSNGQNSLVEEQMRKGISSCAETVWLSVVPQLVARMGIGAKKIRNLLADLLTKVGETFPQALIYPLTVGELSPVKTKREVAKAVLDGISVVNGDLVKSASQISNELVRLAILWVESWEQAIKKAATVHDDPSAIVKILSPLYSKLEDPQTPNEKQFVSQYRHIITSAWNALHRKDTTTAWFHLKKVYSLVSSGTPEKKINLIDVSIVLSEINGTAVAVPGTFTPGNPLIYIDSFLPMVAVIPSKQKPRRFGIVGSDGQTYRFLLKGHEDLRQDERVMQFIYLVNSFFMNDTTSIDHGYTIPCFSVVPLTDNVGIIGWVQNTETIYRMLDARRVEHGISLFREVNIVLAKANATTVSEYHTRPKDVRMNALNCAMIETPNDELAKIIIENNATSEQWLDYRKQYSYTFAIMSMVGYVLGLGDRHLNNIMLQKGGMLVHIDFGDCFEVAMHRKKYAEAVSFRLTRLMVAALGITGVDGAYRITCENVVSLLRKNKENLLSVLEAFIYDPLMNWCDDVDESQQTTNDVKLQKESEPANTPEVPLLSYSISQRNQLIGNAIITDEWATLSEYIKNGVNNEDEDIATSFPPFELAEAVEKVKVCVQNGNFNEAKSWMLAIKKSFPEVCAHSIFEQSIAEKRSPIAKKALLRVQAKLSGTEFPLIDENTGNMNISIGRKSVLFNSNRAENFAAGDNTNQYWQVVKQQSSGQPELAVKDQVDRLIKEATSLENLAESYLTGWAPFW